MPKKSTPSTALHTTSRAALYRFPILPPCKPLRLCGGGQRGKNQGTSWVESRWRLAFCQRAIEPVRMAATGAAELDALDNTREFEQIEEDFQEVSAEVDVGAILARRD